MLYKYYLKLNKIIICEFNNFVNLFVDLSIISTAEKLQFDTLKMNLKNGTHY